MASLQARHKSDCALGAKAWTKLERLDSCTCSPTFYVVSTKDDGKLAREKVGTDREAAEDRLSDVKVLQKEDVYVAPPPAKSFRAFAADWIAGVDRRATTITE